MIASFTGEHEFLSNFSRSPLMFEGERYATVEHAYQAAKTTSAYHRRLIRNAVTPNQAKKLGRRVPLRSDWESVKVEVMKNLLCQKFEDETLARKLLATGNQLLIEGNWWGDRFWGACEASRGDGDHFVDGWLLSDGRFFRGKNMLGKLLMSLRESLHVEAAAGLLFDEEER